MADKACTDLALARIAGAFPLADVVVDLVNLECERQKTLLSSNDDDAQIEGFESAKNISSAYQS